MIQTQILKAQGLLKDFGGVRAVHDVSFEMSEGESLGIIGTCRHAG